MKYFIIFLVLFPSFILAQGNFNIEWEGPANNFYSSITNFEKFNSIPEIVLTEGSLVKVLDGATKQIKYTYSNPDTSSFVNFAEVNSIPFDFNSDGINDIVMTKIAYSNSYFTTIKIINGATGAVVFQNTYNGYYHAVSYDVDGDGFIEICLCNWIGAGTTFKILSTTAHTIKVNENIEHLQDFNLKQNYPNPFNPTTNIEYSIKEKANVKIIVFDILGREVNTILDETKKAGKYSLLFDGSNLSSGTYFYQLIVNNVPETKKMLLTK